MTDDATKPADGAPAKPPVSAATPAEPRAPSRAAAASKPSTQVPPPSAPPPTESLGAVPPPIRPASATAPAPVPPPIPARMPEAAKVTAPAPPPRPIPAPTPPAVAPPKPSGSRGLAVLLALLCVLAILGTGYFYWLGRTALGDLTARLDGLDQRVEALEQRPAATPVNLQPLEQRLATLEKRPAAAAADLQPLDQRLTALEKRPAAAPVDPQPVDQRLIALEQRPTPDVQGLTQRLAALEQKPAPPAPLDDASRAVIASLAGRIDQLTARQDQLGTREQADIGKLGDQLAAQEGKLTTVSQAGSTAGGQVSALAARETKLAALQGAAVALAAGRPLGPLPDAPPALAQFADTPPPTEAGLRLSFAEAANAAHEAGLPPKTDAPFLTRVWARVQSSVTVRQGDRVLLGDPISGILARAQAQLEAGDLAGAVGTLDQLAGPAATAMAPWRQQAQALLDARAALLTSARG